MEAFRGHVGTRERRKQLTMHGSQFLQSGGVRSHPAQRLPVPVLDRWAARFGASGLARVAQGVETALVI